ncbi:MAG: hypothetical protein ACYTDT_13905 [Planctomycetota bacterium]
MQVQAGTLTATQAAGVLGVSRKTYYEWENRALSSMLEAVTNQPPGRPRKDIDHEKLQMARQLEEQQKILDAMPAIMDIRERMILLGMTPGPPTMSTTSGETKKKKKRRKKRK